MEARLSGQGAIEVYVSDASPALSVSFILVILSSKIDARLSSGPPIPRSPARPEGCCPVSANGAVS